MLSTVNTPNYKGDAGLFYLHRVLQHQEQVTNQFYKFHDSPKAQKRNRDQTLVRRKFTFPIGLLTSFALARR